MRDEKKPTAPESAQQAETQKNAAQQPTQRVGGVAAQGTPLDKNIDPSLLVPLQKLNRVKEDDAPGVLFQRMQENQKKTAPKRGRNW